MAVKSGPAEVENETRAMFERLVVQHWDRLGRHISQRLPSHLRGVIDTEAVLQDALHEAWRDMASFRQQGHDSFVCWLERIIRNELFDAIKAAEAASRDFRRRAASPDANELQSGIPDLLEQLIAHGDTPSRPASRREAEEALRRALASLKSEYQLVLNLRYREELSVDEVAKRMDRSRESVMMLCCRAIKKLHRLLGRRSKFLSSG